jgi:acylphosphatase
MEQIYHFKISISGIVQGVGYRYNAVRIARSLGIKGFVRNETDGTVYIEAEGNRRQLDKLISWCYMGPPAAKVNDIQIKESGIKNFKGFDVKY